MNSWPFLAGLIVSRVYEVGLLLPSTTSRVTFGATGVFACVVNKGLPGVMSAFSYPIHFSL